MMAATSPKAPPTAMPTTRNGNSNSHTSGYSTSAISATGQHITNRMHHSKNFTITSAPHLAKNTRKQSPIDTHASQNRFQISQLVFSPFPGLGSLRQQLLPFANHFGPFLLRQSQHGLGSLGQFLKDQRMRPPQFLFNLARS